MAEKKYKYKYKGKATDIHVPNVRGIWQPGEIKSVYKYEAKILDDSEDFVKATKAERGSKKRGSKGKYVMED